MRWQSVRVAAWSLPSSFGSILLLPHVKTGVFFLLTVVTYAEFTENMGDTVGAKAFPSFARNKIWKCAWVLTLMIYVGWGLSMCHLQAHTSQMQMLFSMRKGNLPKRSFPDNNLRYGCSIAIPLAVHQKPNQMSYTVDFLGINNWNLAYTSWHFPFFYCAHPGMPQICHGTHGRSGTPWPVAVNSLSAPKGPEVLVVWYSFLLSWAHYPDDHSG